MTPPDLPCNRFIVVVTDFLDGALPPDVTEQVHHHLSICRGCAEVLLQWRRTIELTGSLSQDVVEACDPMVKATLLEAFRSA